MAIALLTPSEFNRAWGPGNLVRLPSEAAISPIPTEASAFLIQAGLPALIRQFSGSTEEKITFCRLASRLSPVLSEKTVGPQLPDDWSVYWVLGDEFFCNGAAWWSIHQENRSIYRIDIEIDPPIEFANTSIAHFASALLAASVWFEKTSRSPEKWPAELDEFWCELESLDPPSMASGKNYWPMYLNFIRDEGPNLCDFKKGSVAEGKLALNAGPW
jgi:hypothetical protein